jgi:formate hydrogenlyase subunit 3/multisubunit Na+/H+ antiporter MnhD subunit
MLIIILIIIIFIIILIIIILIIIIIKKKINKGGNVEESIPNEVFITKNGVKIIGYTNLLSRLPTTASLLYAKNIVNFLLSLSGKKNNTNNSNYNKDFDFFMKNMLIIDKGLFFYLFKFSIVFYFEIYESMFITIFSLLLVIFILYCIVYIYEKTSKKNEYYYYFFFLKK